MPGTANALDTTTTNSNGIVTWNGSVLTNYAGPQISSLGRMTNTSQPAFFASYSVPATNVTGAAMEYPFIFNSVSYDQTGMYNNTTGNITIPVTGIYLIFLRIPITSVTTLMTTGDIGFNGSVGFAYAMNNPGTIKDGNNISDIQIVPTFKFTSGDVVHARMQISNGAGNTAGVGTGASLAMTLLC